MPRPEYAGVEWQAVRRMVLARDGYVCQLRRPKCTFKATQVDHVISVTNGGPRLDPANLVATCEVATFRSATRRSPPGRGVNRGTADSSAPSTASRCRSANTSSPGRSGGTDAPGIRGRGIAQTSRSARLRHP